MSKKDKNEKSKFISSRYKIEDGKLRRFLPTCDRCGPGYFMADHGNRYACGHCGFTKYKTKNYSEEAPRNKRAHSSD